MNMIEILLRIGLSRHGVNMPLESSLPVEGNRLDTVLSNAISDNVSTLGPVAEAIHNVMKPVVDGQINKLVGPPALAKLLLPQGNGGSK